MSINQDFLDKYTELETFLRERNSDKIQDKYHFNIFLDKEINKNRVKWDLYRDIRNLLTHEHGIRNGMTVTEKLYQLFVDDVNQIIHPKKAIDIAVPIHKIYKVKKSQTINTIIQTMLDKNYTCTPIVNEQGIIVGIFSAHSLMLYFNKHKQEILKDMSTVKVSDFEQFCNLQNNPDIAYKFVSRNTTVNDVKDLFKENFNHTKRLNVIFITNTGKSTEKVLALLTPWDLAKYSD